MKLRKVTAMLSALVMMVSTVGMTVSAASFPDVSKGDWYYDYVTDVSEKGYITGYANGKFGATDNLTREQLATIMYRYAKWEGQDVSKAGSLSKFPDGSKVSAFAKDAVSWAVGEGIISGNADGTLAPQGTVSRAVAATIISRYTSNGNEENTTPSTPDIPSNPTDPEAHTHVWEEITVQEPVYGPLFVAICDQCGEDISEPGGDVAHFNASWDKYYNGEISIEEVCMSQTVTFTGETGIVAYETKVVGYKCACGATK